MSTVVVLPRPFGPSRPRTSPRPTSKLMPRKATRRTKDFPGRRRRRLCQCLTWVISLAFCYAVSIADRSTSTNSSSAESISGLDDASPVSSSAAKCRDSDSTSVRPDDACHTTSRCAWSRRSSHPEFDGVAETRHRLPDRQTRSVSKRTGWSGDCPAGKLRDGAEIDEDVGRTDRAQQPGGPGRRK